MKNILFSLITVLAISGQAMATYTSVFQEKTEYAIGAYDNAQECNKVNGEWRDDLCFFPSKNIVEVDLTGDEVTRVAVETTSDNGNQCYFESSQVTESEGQLTASAMGTVYDYESDTSVKALCEVYVKKDENYNISVTSNGKCMEWCGARAYLYLEKGIKIK